jgi:ketosteroid isomerase-like protein
MQEHPNATRMRQTVDAFMSGDMPRLLQGFADDVVWYAPGDTPVSGTFHGHEGIIEFFSGLNEPSGESMNVRVDDVLAGDRYVTIFLDITAERHDERLSVIVAQFASADGQGRWDRCWFLPDKLDEWNRFFAGASSGQR